MNWTLRCGSAHDSCPATELAALSQTPRLIGAGTRQMRWERDIVHGDKAVPPFRGQNNANDCLYMFNKLCMHLVVCPYISYSKSTTVGSPVAAIDGAFRQTTSLVTSVWRHRYSSLSSYWRHVLFPRLLAHDELFSALRTGQGLIAERVKLEFTIEPRF